MRTIRRTVYNGGMQEYERIVEFSFNPKEEKFVIRFLDGSSYSLCVTDLPKKMQTKKPKWEEAILSDDKVSILVSVGNEARVIPSHMIHARGQVL